MHYRAFWDWSALLVLNVFTGDVKTAGTFLRPKGHSMFRFTIRDLLWLMVVVGLSVGWCLQQAQLNQARYDYTNDPFYYTAPNYRYRRDGRDYQTNQYGIKKLDQALQAGYNEGYKAGRADREDHWRNDYRSAFAYQDANYGYDGRYIAQDEYNHYFREGFQRGYDDGYYSLQKYGKKNDSGGINDEWLIAGAVVAAIIAPKVLPRGTRIECTAVYDNSANNPYNPDPKSTVFWGPQSWDEMMIGWFDVTLRVTRFPDRPSRGALMNRP